MLFRKDRDALTIYVQGRVLIAIVGAVAGAIYGGIYGRVNLHGIGQALRELLALAHP